MFSGIRLLIQGTKNAYTTLQIGDCVLYTTDENGDFKKTLGYLTKDYKIQQLGVFEVNDSKYHSYTAVPPIPAQQLIDAKNLLRIVSSDRRNGTFTVDEYLGDDVYIPVISNTPADLITTPSNFNSTSAAQTGTFSPPRVTEVNDDNHSSGVTKITINSDFPNQQLLLLQAELKVAKLELQLLHEQIKMNSTQNSVINSDSKLHPRSVDQSRSSESTTHSHLKYCRKVTKSGQFLFVSGCVGVDVYSYVLAKTTTDDFIKSISSMSSLEIEVHEAVKNIKSILLDHQCDLKNIVTFDVYVKQPNASDRIHKLMLHEFGITANEDHEIDNEDQLSTILLPRMRFVEANIPLTCGANFEIDVQVVL
ncbi:unnamed protein product [Sphagnum jensenii]|uniref:Uncharacterized protein n=1 Tax=Sphagnum jensenii TaxID=128206 RepID=A0ABP0VBS0_9BRYO